MAIRKINAEKSIEFQGKAESEIVSGIDRVGRWTMDRPYWFATIVILALLLLPVAVWLDLRHLSNESLTRQAADLNSTISEIRSYYGRNVVGRVQANNGIATPAHNYADIDGGIPIPATLSIELGNIIGKKGGNIGYRFVSDFAFNNRKPHQLTAFEATAVKRFRDPDSTSRQLTEISGSLMRRQIKMAVPVVMGTSCVSCHNSHPQSPKTDWKVGDVRGIQSISVEQPIAANMFSFKYLLIYLLGACTFGLSFVVLQWRQAVQYSKMNSELGEVNSFLATISTQISKYLPPQIYKSIFRGERDVSISTERKKLTIFFSDIKDFTASTQRLQPEELAALLNEYFSEMEKIANQHGGTVDKFIGDAILVFFGDPDTKGTKADAWACVEMAIAMQRRMVELNQQWRRQGVEKPFLVRMGINTGYCNVGNFGSLERMDYTIIGAEANLAARLESIAKPGGIVMSYETYSLVQDTLVAHPMEKITLKGISRKIVPYKIVNIHNLAKQPDLDVLNQKTNGLKLKINLSKADKAQKLEIENALKSALLEVQKQHKHL